MTSFSLIVLGRGGPSLAAYGIGSMSLYSHFFLLFRSCAGKARSKTTLRKGSYPNCNRHIVHCCLPDASGSGSRPWSGAQSQQRHSSKLPSGLHFHNRNLLGTYFITASLERIVDLVKGKSSHFG